MTHRFDQLAHHPLKSLVQALCVAAIVTACGGGGTSGSSSRTSFASGPITGLGSIYVNGVRYDDSSANVSSEDDDNGASRSKSELKLGMVVEVEASGSSSDGSTRSGKASEIRFGSEIVGPVGAEADIKLTATGGTFKLLGQTIVVDAKTIFDNSLSSGYLSLTPNTVIEVHGIRQTDGSYLATRIEAESTTHFKLRGAISDLDKTGKTFKIGGELISYAVLGAPAFELTDGMNLRVKLETQQNAAGAWVATRIKSGVRRMSDHDEAEVKGAIEITGDPKTYRINGMDVVVSATTELPAALVSGDFVEVEGRVEGGKLIAREIKLEDDNSPDFGAFEFKDNIANLLETAGGADKFAVKGMTIRVDANTLFTSPATRAGIKAGDCVEVKATPIVGSTDLLAELIKLDNSCR